MRTASYVGFVAMVVVFIGAFAWVDAGWATVLLLLLAIGIGWYSLGLFARASTGAAWRAMRGVATDSDTEELGHLGPRALATSIARAAAAPDAQRDRIYQEFVEGFGGIYGTRKVVAEHMASHGVTIDVSEADYLLDAWRIYGIVQTGCEAGAARRSSSRPARRAGK